MEEIKTKVCATCHAELPVEEFSKNANAKDGLQSSCRKCKSAYMKEYWKRKVAKIEEERIENERVEFEKKYKIYTNRELAKFTPRELMLELKARGYRGTLIFEEVIVNRRNIDLDKFN